MRSVGVSSISLQYNRLYSFIDLEREPVDLTDLLKFSFQKILYFYSFSSHVSDQRLRAIMKRRFYLPLGLEQKTRREVLVLESGRGVDVKRNREGTVFFSKKKDLEFQKKGLNRIYNVTRDSDLYGKNEIRVPLES